MSSRSRTGLPRADAVSPFAPVSPFHGLGTIARVCAMVAAAALPAASWAADAELGEITVRSTTDPQALPTVAPGGQVAKGAGLGVLGQRDVMDTPFNITSYTAEGIADQHATTLMSVLENDPSVRFTTNTGHAYENFTIRGLGVNASELGFNGLYGLAPDGHVPTEMIERVEVLKGPGALLSGMTPGGAVGGTINLVTKRPLARDLTRVTTMLSSSSQLGLQADVSRRFGPERRLGIRINGSTSGGDTEIDGQNRRHGLGALALDYQGDGFTLGLAAYSYRSHIRAYVPSSKAMR
jgi:iron complex outermembrane recepter protein